MSSLNYEKVRAAVEVSGSIRKAAKQLGTSYNVVQYWLVQNGYAVEKRAVLIKRPKRA